MVCVRKYIVCICLVQNGSFMHPFVPTSQKIIYVGLFTIIVLNFCVSGDEILNDFGISFPSQFGSLRICFVKFLGRGGIESGRGPNMGRFCPP